MGRREEEPDASRRHARHRASPSPARGESEEEAIRNQLRESGWKKRRADSVSTADGEASRAKDKPKDRTDKGSPRPADERSSTRSSRGVRRSRSPRRRDRARRSSHRKSSGSRHRSRSHSRSPASRSRSRSRSAGRRRRRHSSSSRKRRSSRSPSRSRDARESKCSRRSTSASKRKEEKDEKKEEKDVKEEKNKNQEDDDETESENENEDAGEKNEKKQAADKENNKEEKKDDKEKKEPEDKKEKDDRHRPSSSRKSSRRSRSGSPRSPSRSSRRRRHRRNSSYSRSPSRSRRARRGGSRSRSRSPRDRRPRGRDRDRERERDRDRRSRRRGRSYSRSRSASYSRRRRRNERSNSRDRPRREAKKSPEPSLQPPAGTEAAAPTAATAAAAPGAAPAAPPSSGVNPTITQLMAQYPTMSLQDIIAKMQASNVTMAAAVAQKPARELYVGNLPPNVTGPQLQEFLSTIIQQVGLTTQPGNPIVNTWISTDGHFAFCEMRSVEECNLALLLNQLSLLGQPLKFGRPRSFMGPPQPMPQISARTQTALTNLGCTPNPAWFAQPAVPSLDGVTAAPHGDSLTLAEATMTAVSAAQTTVPAVASATVDASSASHRLIMSNIPVVLAEDQVKELVEPFGALKSFTLVKDTATGASIGSALFEYEDDSVAAQAVEGLNGLSIGGILLSVQRQPPSGAALPAAPGATPNFEDQPSAVLKMANMVSIDELRDDDEYADLAEDVEEECKRFGNVTGMEIPRPKDGEEVPGLGCIYVRFEEEANAVAALKALNGRKFGGSIVKVTYFPLDKVAELDYKSCDGPVICAQARRKIESNELGLHCCRLA
ncbi:hypothetical protein PF010_g13336 [Phytophthora fragariae]|uniref:RRM domain-containing protein n=1 Tax=Phytophthora fragariae TaxID=53985 RepID=A0A6G0L0U7_9STRA|nr:hypothetical protein PF010_g13336 [Phytophthora fragariae]